MDIAYIATLSYLKYVKLIPIDNGYCLSMLLYTYLTLLKLIAIDNGYCLVCYYILILLYWS